MEEPIDVKNYLERGVFLSKTDKMKKGQPSRCHQNSADLYLKYKNSKKRNKSRIKLKKALITK
jgi:hypothetical protein